VDVNNIIKQKSSTKRLIVHRNYSQLVKDAVHFSNLQDGQFLETADVALKTYETLKFSQKLDSFLSAEDNSEISTIAEIDKQLEFVSLYIIFGGSCKLSIFILRLI